MALQYTGNVLAVNIETVTPREGDTWSEFQSVNIVCMDDGRVLEMKAGRDLPPADLQRLRSAPAMSRVLCEVFVHKGATYATRLLDIESAAKAS